MATTVRDILSAKPKAIFAVRSSDSVHEVLAVLAEHNIGALMVIDDDALVGIVSERDCALKVALPGARARDVPVSEIMTPDVTTMGPDQRLDECMLEMSTRDIRHLPVVESGRVLGMVSVGDVVKATIKEQERHIGYLETYIRGYGNP